MRILYIIIFFIQISWGQISMNDCRITTQKAIGFIESNNLENAFELFSNPSANSKNTIKKASLIYNSNVSFSKTFITTSTKIYFVNRYIYKSNDGETGMVVNFYYKKQGKTALIDKIEVKDKNDFIAKKRKNNNQRIPIIGRVPPPGNINN